MITSHIAVNYGSLLELKKDTILTVFESNIGSKDGSKAELRKDSFWHIFKSYKLTGAPKFMIIEKDSILIITSEHILSFNKNEELDIILKAPFYWGSLYPSSAVIENKDMYIAMRKGILKIMNFRHKPDYEWYLKK